MYSSIIINIYTCEQGAQIQLVRLWLLEPFMSVVDVDDDDYDDTLSINVSLTNRDCHIFFAKINFLIMWCTLLLALTTEVIDNIRLQALFGPSALVYGKVIRTCYGGPKSFAIFSTVPFYGRFLFVNVAISKKVMRPYIFISTFAKMECLTVLLG